MAALGRVDRVCESEDPWTREGFAVAAGIVGMAYEIQRWSKPLERYEAFVKEAVRTMPEGVDGVFIGRSERHRYVYVYAATRDHTQDVAVRMMHLEDQWSDLFPDLIVHTGVRAHYGKTKPEELLPGFDWYSTRRI